MIIRLLFLALVTTGLITSCSETKKSTAGESCAKTDDCAGDLRCVANTCGQSTAIAQQVTPKAPRAVTAAPEKPVQEAPPVPFDKEKAASKIWGAEPPWRVFKSDDDAPNPVNSALEKRGTVLSSHALAGDDGDLVVMVVGEKDEFSSSPAALVLYKRDGGKWAVVDRLLLSGCESGIQMAQVKLGKQRVGLQYDCCVNSGSGLCVGEVGFKTLFTAHNDRLQAIDHRYYAHGQCDEDREVTFKIDESGDRDIYDVEVTVKRSQFKCTHPPGSLDDLPKAELEPDCETIKTTTQRTRWRHQGPDRGYVRMSE